MEIPSETNRKAASVQPMNRREFFQSAALGAAAIAAGSALPASAAPPMPKIADAGNAGKNAVRKSDPRAERSRLHGVGQPAPNHRSGELGHCRKNRLAWFLIPTKSR